MGDNPEVSVVPTQADREAAERLEEELGFLTREESRISEEHFARHRLAHQTPPATQPIATVGEVERVIRAARDLLDRFVGPDPTGLMKARAYEADTVELERALDDLEEAATLHTPPPVATATVVDAGEEYMSVSIDRDGKVTSHNAYDANFDDMVEATRKIIAALQDRLNGRDRCPFRSGKSLREDATPTPPAGDR